MFFFQVHCSDPWAIVEYGKKTIQFGLSRLHPIGIYEDDPILGYRHKSDLVGHHRALDFSVDYTLNESGNRVLPQPEKSVGRIAFIGGSYTFGHGVQDDETFASILAREYWPEWSVVNRSVSGYGTAHAYLTLKELFENDEAPDVVIYPLLNAHIIRNYINEVWIRSITPFGRKHPHFELESGKLVYQGLVGIDDAKPASKEVTARERMLTQVLVHELQRLCDANGAQFFLILLPGEKWPPSVVASLYDLKNRPLDLSHYRIKGFSDDGHPNPSDHEFFAEQIGHSAITEVLRTLKATRVEAE